MGPVHLLLSSGGSYCGRTTSELHFDLRVSSARQVVGMSLAQSCMPPMLVASKKDASNVILPFGQILFQRIGPCKRIEASKDTLHTNHGSLCMESKSNPELFREPLQESECFTLLEDALHWEEGFFSRTVFELFRLLLMDLTYIIVSSNPYNDASKWTSLPTVASRNHSLWLVGSLCSCRLSQLHNLHNL